MSVGEIQAGLPNKPLGLNLALPPRPQGEQGPFWVFLFVTGQYQEPGCILLLSLWKEPAVFKMRELNLPGYPALWGCLAYL